MKEIIVNSGFGYFTRQGRVIAKAELPPGNHPALDDVEYVEVGSAADLARIEVYQDPKDKTKQENELKIVERSRKLALESLKADGTIPAGYE